MKLESRHVCSLACTCLITNIFFLTWYQSIYKSKTQTFIGSIKLEYSDFSFKMSYLEYSLETKGLKVLR